MSAGTRRTCNRPVKGYGPMEIGVVYPQIELRGDPIAVRQFAVAAEYLGFDHLLD
jgi:hypothetical protein